MLVSHNCPGNAKCHIDTSKVLLKMSTHSPRKTIVAVYILKLLMSCIQSRFDQKGFKIFSSVEQLLLKACSGKSFDEDLKIVCEFFYDDFINDELASELLTL